MKNILMGIPSYFGWDEIREIRYKAHQKQLEWIKQLQIPTIIYAQDYAKNEYDDSLLITYEKQKKPEHWAIFKKKFLEYFYTTDFMWGIIADNDAGLYDHHLGYNIFYHMDQFPNLWKQIDFWYPLDPRKEPFTHLYNNYPTIYADNLIFVQTSLTTKGTMFIVKNPKYTKKKPVLFSAETSCDDTEFTIKCIINGWNVYKCNSSIMKELVNSSEHSTIKWLADIKERARIVIEEKKLLAKRHNIPITERKNGGISFKSKIFCNKYMKNSPKTIAIPKKENDLCLNSE